jgi:hypothetical protein
MKNKKCADPLGSHVRLYHSLLKSHAWRALSTTARTLYIDLRMKLNGSNNGDISAAMTDLRPYGWTSPATVSKALKELRIAGFIDVTRPGGFPKRSPTLYRFTDQETYERPDKGIEKKKASHNYQKYQSVEQAREAVRQGVQAMTEQNRGRQSPKKTRVQ